jgi:hypothetical protein
MLYKSKTVAVDIAQIRGGILATSADPANVRPKFQAMSIQAAQALA